jgi:hypothetical protein
MLLLLLLMLLVYHNEPLLKWATRSNHDKR